MATNKIESLDPALIRPGRIDRKIEFPLPDIKTKRRIFGIHTVRYGVWYCMYSSTAETKTILSIKIQMKHVLLSKDGAADASISIELEIAEITQVTEKIKHGIQRKELSVQGWGNGRTTAQTHSFFPCAFPRKHGYLTFLHRKLCTYRGA